MRRATLNPRLQDAKELQHWIVEFLLSATVLSATLFSGEQKFVYRKFANYTFLDNSNISLMHSGFEKQPATSHCSPELTVLLPHPHPLLILLTPQTADFPQAHLDHLTEHSTTRASVQWWMIESNCAWPLFGLCGLAWFVSLSASLVPPWQIPCKKGPWVHTHAAECINSQQLV